MVLPGIGVPYWGMTDRIHPPVGSGLARRIKSLQRHFPRVGETAWDMRVQVQVHDISPDTR